MVFFPRFVLVQEPICHFCHLYGAHKGHEAVLLEVFVDTQRNDLASHQEILSNVLQSGIERTVSLRSIMDRNDHWLRTSQEQLRRVQASIMAALEAKVAACEIALRKRHEVTHIRIRCTD